MRYFDEQNVSLSPFVQTKNSTQKHTEQEHSVMVQNLINVCFEMALLTHKTTETATLTSEHIYTDSSGK
jgi:hypothetical protein